MMPTKVTLALEYASVYHPIGNFNGNEISSFTQVKYDKEMVVFRDTRSLPVKSSAEGEKRLWHKQKLSS
jgi:hypothetical protein